MKYLFSYPLKRQLNKLYGGGMLGVAQFKLVSELHVVEVLL